jgi:hypothetical protein
MPDVENIDRLFENSEENPINATWALAIQKLHNGFA